MEQVHIHKGRIIIPHPIAMARFKPKPGMLKRLMEGHFSNVRWDGKSWTVVADADTVRRANEVFRTALDVPMATTPATLVFPFKTTPEWYQLEALNKCNGREAFAYLMEPGCGKTKVAIDDAQILAKNGQIDQVIVTCPKSIVPTWLREIKKHGHYDFWEISYWDSDSGEIDVDYRPSHLGIHCPKPEVRWLIVPITSVIFEEAWEVIHRFVCQSSKTMAVVDESTSIRKEDSKRTKVMLKVRDMVEYRRILTGTLIANTPLDAYAQMTFLDPYIFRGWSFYAFRSRYAIMGGYKKKQVMGYLNKDELAKTIDEHSYIITKGEALPDLPVRDSQRREITLSDKSWKIYEKIVDEVMIDVAGHITSVDMVITKIVKLRQLVSGFIVPEWEKELDERGKPTGRNIGSKPEPVWVGHEKLDDLMETMEEFRGHKIIIWCQFLPEIHKIYDMVSERGFKVVKYYGDLKIRERQEAEDSFEQGDVEVFVCQIDTGGMGLSLNAADISIFYSHPQYQLPRTQALERNLRRGKTRIPINVDMVAVGTVENACLDSIESRQDFADNLMKAARDPEAMERLMYGGLKRTKWNKKVKRR